MSEKPKPGSLGMSEEFNRPMSKEEFLEFIKFDDSGEDLSKATPLHELVDLEAWSEEQEISPTKRRKRTRAIPSRKRNQ